MTFDWTFAIGLLIIAAFTIGLMIGRFTRPASDRAEADALEALLEVAGEKNGELEILLAGRDQRLASIHAATKPFKDYCWSSDDEEDPEDEAGPEQPKKTELVIHIED